MALFNSALRLKSVSVGLLVVVLSLSVSYQCVFAAEELNEESIVRVPSAIRVPSGYELHLVLHAEGEQYYRFNGTGWVNFSAKAALFKRVHQEKRVAFGRHFYLSHPDRLGGQPSWETFPSKGVSGSLVTGIAVATTKVDAGSIAWVLLKATHTSGDKRYLGDVVYIQRINTHRGLGPSSTAGAHKGDVRKSSYTADYAFYVKKY